MIAAINTKIDRDIKEKATEILKSKGINMTDYLRQAIMRVVEDGEIPFKLHIPNDATVAAMKESNEIMKRMKKKYEGVL